MDDKKKKIKEQSEEWEQESEQNAIVGDFFKVSTEIIKRINSLFFDVYIKTGADKFVKIFKKDTQPEIERIEKYESKGVAELYILNKDRKTYFLKADQIVENLLKDNTTDSTQKVELLHELTNLVMMEIYKDIKMDDVVIERTYSTSKAIVEHLARDTKSLAAFIRSSNSDFYLCKHSVAVCALSLLLAQALGNESTLLLQTLGVGSILHDIGLAQIDPVVACKRVEELNADEMREYKLHPLYGMNMLQQSKEVTAEVRQIIYQHHEQPNGQGFPNFLHGPSISYLAKIVSIADNFSDLTTKFGERETVSPYEAIVILQERKGAFDESILKIFVNLIVPK
jgi:HD-GYP domain-containing protein (c-di-GMP phosphodiesterase class II)